MAEIQFIETTSPLIPLFAMVFSGLAALLLLVWLRQQAPGTAFVMTLAIPILFFIASAMAADATGDEWLLWPGVIIPTILFFAGLISLARIPLELARDKAPWPKTWAQWILKFVGICSILILLLGMFNILGLLLFGLFLGAMFQSGKSVHHAQALEVVSTLHLCVQQNLPMAMALKTAAQYQKRNTAAIMEAIGHWLVHGYPLSQALRKGWPRAPKDLYAAVEAGEKIGQLPRTLKALTDDLEIQTEESKKEQLVDLTYPAVVLTVVLLILIGLCVFIVPTFAEVLYDISDGTERLPVITQILVNISGFMTSRKGLPAALIVLLPFILYGMTVILYQIFRGHRITLKDWLQWHLPLRRGFEWDRCLHQLVQYIQAALRAGLDVKDALREALNLDLNLCYKNRIRRWIEQIEAGQPVGPAAIRTGMGRAIGWAFSEPNQRNLPAVLKMIEETTESNYTYRTNLIRSISFPFIILMLGSAVGFVVLAFFLPMIKLVILYTGYTMLP